MDTDSDGTFDCDELPAVAATTASADTGEDGTNASFGVKLNSPPDGDVILLIESTDSGEGIVSPATVTFTSLNWHADQTVNIAGVDDDEADGNQSYLVRLTVDAELTTDTTGYANLDPVEFEVINRDNDREPEVRKITNNSCFINSLGIQ